MHDIWGTIVTGQFSRERRTDASGWG